MTVTVAVDLLGLPDGGQVLRGLAVPGVELLLVGPGGDVETGPLAPTTADEVRASRAGSARVAARLVRDGRADACVLAGPLGAVAATFSLGPLRGCSRPVHAAVAPAGTVLADVSGEPGADLAVAGLLAGLVAGSPVVPASGADVATGAVRAAVFDGPTGAVLLSALTAGAPAPGLLLGLSHVVAVVHGPATGAVVQACVRLAATAVQSGLVRREAAALAALVEQRRSLAGWSA